MALQTNDAGPGIPPARNVIRPLPTRTRKKTAATPRAALFFNGP